MLIDCRWLYYSNNFLLAISVLTGMITRDKGNVSINGLDIDDDLDEIRKGTGICNQKDVLYDKMSAKEHLRYLCELKGIPQD